MVFTSDWPTGPDAALGAFDGQLVGMRGRGILATFDNCHNAMLALASAGQKVPLAAGLAFGELAFEQDDGFGEAIVAAARLAAICPVGSVLSTDLARQHLNDLPADELGSTELKGIGTVGHHRFDLEAADGCLHDQTASDRADTAVLSCDIVASTALLESAGTEVAITVRQVFDEATAAACRTGEVLHVRGDGVVARFASATDAIRAAIEMHRFVDSHGLRSGATAFSLRSGVAVGPDPETEAVALESSGRPGQIVLSETAQAVAFDLSDEVKNGAITPHPTAAAPFPLELVTKDDFPLVGREPTLARLSSVWKESLLGQSSACFVTGEAGIGKTRLISTFARRCHDDGALVLFGSSDMEMAAPYRPFARALRNIADLDARSAARLTPLFPQQSSEREDTGEGGAEAVATDRTQLFDAVYDCLVAISDARPVLLVLDDLHWSSSATALLLRHLLLNPPAGRVMVLCTFRDAEVDRAHPLFGVVNDQQVANHATRVPLDNLSVDDVADLVAAHFGTAVGDNERRLADRIHTEGGGLPFFTGEMLRHIDREGVGADSDETLALPASLVDAVHQRLGRLDDATCRMLEAAATSGLYFDLDVLAATLGTNMGSLVDQLEGAERLALVHESGRAGYYQFDHSLIRSALLGRLSATKIAVMHQRIAEALGQLPGDHNDALAHHWRQATGPVARQRAVHHLVLSAERDASSLAWEAAKARYEDALELAGDDGVIDRETVAAIHLDRARAMRAVGDPEYLVAMQETGRLARRAGLSHVIAQVAVNSTKPGTWFANANEPDDHLIGLCEEALEWPDLEPALRCRVLSTLATNLAFDGDRARRKDMVDEAVQLARSVGSPELVASALIAKHLAFWDPSTFDDRVEIIDELDRIARRRDNPDHLFLAGFFRASMLIESGRIPEARTVLEGLDGPIERTRNFWFRFLVDRIETALDLASCHPEAKMRVDKLFEQSFETQADAAGTWGAQLGGLAIQAGTFGSMVGQLAEASERSRGQGVWSCGLAIAQLDQGDTDGAAATLAGLKDAPFDFMWLVSQQMIAEAAYRSGDRELCAVTLERLRPFAGRVGVIASGTLIFGPVSTSIGEVALGAGDVELAVASLHSAIEQADTLGLPFFQVRTRRRLLEALPNEPLEGLAAEALELATAHGFASEVAAIVELQSQ